MKPKQNTPTDNEELGKQLDAIEAAKEQQTGSLSLESLAKKHS